MFVTGVSRLVLSAAACCAVAGPLCSDYDGDGFLDSLRVGDFQVHLFASRDTAPDEARPVGENWERVLREGLAGNDFVFDFLHRAEASEVANVRAAAIEIVGDAATDREKVQRILDWLSANWDFSVEHSFVNAFLLLKKRQGRCETSGLLVGMLDTLGIKAREVTVATPGPAPSLAVEVWLEGKWHVADLFGQRRIDERSVVEMLPGRESEAGIVYYWRDTRGRLLRSKLWHDPLVAQLFVTDRGLSARDIPTLGDLRISY